MTNPVTQAEAEARGDNMASDGRFKWMRVTLSFLLAAAVALALTACGGSSSDDLSQDDRYEQVRAERERAKKEREQREEESLVKPDAPAKNWIKRAFFTPHKVKAGMALNIKIEGILPSKPGANCYYSYIYWKNGEMLMDETRVDTLTPENYKKGDVVYADVQLYMDGEVIEKKRSEMVEIVNSSPIIHEDKIPKMEGPGAYEITVKATDIDGDAITFSLKPFEKKPARTRAQEEGEDGEYDEEAYEEDAEPAEPVWEGLDINSATGTVTCTLGEEPPPGQLRFVIVADDGDKGIAKKAVTINFTINKKTSQPKQTGEKKDGEEGTEEGEEIG
jgi:hypothetical protein